MKNVIDKKNKGAIMVEAAIYIPVVMMIVVALIELALFNMQEYMMMYEAQRVSAVVSRDVAYVGYGQFDMGKNNQIDFVSFPSGTQVESYYSAYHERISTLYREISGIISAASEGKTDASGFVSKFADAAASSSLIAIGTVSSPTIKVSDNLLGTGVTVTFTHEIPVPGVLRYLGYDGTTDLRVAAYTYSVNPSEFARNVDLATDMLDFVFEKLGLSGSFNELKSKTSDILSKIL